MTHGTEVKLNGIEFQNHCIRTEEAHTTKQTQAVPLSKQNIHYNVYYNAKRK